MIADSFWKGVLVIESDVKVESKGRACHMGQAQAEEVQVDD